MQFLTTPAELVAALKSGTKDCELFARKQFRVRYTNLVADLIRRSLKADKGQPGDSPLRDRCLECVLCDVEMNLKAQGAEAFRGWDWEQFDAWVLVQCSRLTWVFRLLVEPSVKAGTSSLPRSKSFSLGRIVHSQFVIGWFDQPREVVGGDWWEYEPLDAGSLLMIVADVTDHGVLSHILRDGLSHLWRMCLEERPASGISPAMLAARLDQELADVFPEGRFVDATVVRFDLEPDCALAICPGEHEREHTTACGAYRGLISGGAWLGIGDKEFPSDERRRSFPVDSGLVISTDGLKEQPVRPEAAGQSLLDLLWTELASCEGSHSIHDVVMERCQASLRGLEDQPDDVCVVTVTLRGESDGIPSIAAGADR